MKSQFIIVPSVIAQGMTGADRAYIDGNYVRLRYTDGTLEDAILTDSELGAGLGNWVSMVSSVQSKRKKNATPQSLH